MTGWFWARLCLLACPVSTLLGSWFCVRFTCGSSRSAAAPSGRAKPLPLRPPACRLWLDLCFSIWRIVFVFGGELKEEPSVLLWAPEESESERAKRDESEPSHTSFPSGPRNWAALCRQVEMPSWKECLWPPLPPSAPARLSLVMLCRKRTACSSISAFSTLQFVPTCRRTCRRLKESTDVFTTVYSGCTYSLGENMSK